RERRIGRAGEGRRRGKREGGGQQGPAELVLHGVLGTWRNYLAELGATARGRGGSCSQDARPHRARRQYDSEWSGWFHEIITPSRCAASRRAGGQATMPAWTSS